MYKRQIGTAGEGRDALQNQVIPPTRAIGPASPPPAAEGARSARQPVAPSAATAPRTALDGMSAEERLEALLRSIERSGLKEDEAADLVAVATGGRTKNLTHLSDGEGGLLMAVLVRIADGKLDLGYDQGQARLVDGDGHPVRVALDGRGVLVVTPAEAAPFPSMDAWKGLLKDTPGVGQAALLRQAKAIAEELGVDVPRALDQLTHPELAERLRSWLEERRPAA